MKIYQCIEDKCDNKVSDTNRRCNSCANKSKRNPMFGKKRNNKGTKNPNFKYTFSKEYLVKNYIKQKKTITQIANERKCSYEAIRHNLVNYEIPRRLKMQTNPTKWESLFASFLNKLNVDFIRQYKIGTYCCDFYLANNNLIIEIDGYSKSDERKQFIVDRGYNLLHIKNKQLVSLNVKKMLEDYTNDRVN